jgi:hypothetical protein
MNKIFRRFLIRVGIVGGMVLLFILATPRAVHAIAAVLVDVSNTPLKPAITQDVSRLAATQVLLVGSIGLGSPGNFHQVNSGSQDPNVFQVPVGESLVITTVDVGTSPGGFANLIETEQGNNVVLATWLWPTTGDPVTLQFHYPSGLVLASNSVPIIGGETPGNTTISVRLFGYLTAN